MNLEQLEKCSIDFLGEPKATGGAVDYFRFWDIPLLKVRRALRELRKKKQYSRAKAARRIYSKKT